MAFLKRILDAFKSSDAATSQLPPGSDKTRRYLSVDIDQAARESQLLISYVSAEAGIEVDQTVVQKIVNAKYRSQRGDWDAQSEVEFWVALDTMTRAIHPVTMESLIATKPLVRKGRQRASPAQRAVSRYRVLAVLSLLVLLTLQIYWLVGAHANLELNQRTQEIAVADEEIQYIEQAHGDTAGTYDDANLDSLSEKRRAMIRDQEAHFQLLRSWNKKMWLFPTGQTLAGGVTEYRSRQHASELGQVEARIETLTAGLDSGGYAQGIDEPGQQAITRQRIEGELAGLRRAQATLALQPVAEKESNELAAQQLAAHLVVTSLDEYFLPLVYGLLGAAMFVLRRLSEEIRHLTYRADSEILYGLRITMGALAGLTIGWFLRPESSTDLNILPGLSLAFLVGYNVEVLFSAMDRVIATVSKRHEEKVATAEKAAG